jgi:hypothetical protein
MNHVFILFFIFSTFAMERAEEKECSICRELIAENEAVLTCADVCEKGIKEHIFHRTCLKLFLMYGTGVYTCPECNRPLKKEAQRLYPRAPERVRALMLEMFRLNVGLEELLERIHVVQRNRSRDDLAAEGIGFPACSIL